MGSPHARACTYKLEYTPLFFQMHAHSRLASCFGMHLHQYQHGRLPFCIVWLRVAAAYLLTYNTSHPTHRASHLAPRTPHHAWHRAYRTSHLALSSSHLTYHILQPTACTSHRTMHIAPLTPYPHHSHHEHHRHDHHQHHHSRHRPRPYFYPHSTHCSHHAKIIHRHASPFVVIHRHR
jgi:hypothetical protein